MGFVKVIKGKAYFKRYQVQYRRRRECKTDYQQRMRLITQDKNKYNAPKYRLVARFTNKKVIAQIIYSKIVGDFVLCEATSAELPRFGVPVGLTNYAAAYATGLLLARRLLTQIKLNDLYKGQEKVTGDDFNVTAVEDKPRPFKALLDVGLARTTTGAKVFAVMKGACDGGVNIPHKKTRFVGFDAESKKLNTAVLRGHIFGAHVSEHMKQLQADDEESYKKHYSQYIKNNIAPKDVEAMYTKAHASIRKDPSALKKEKKVYKADAKFAKDVKKTLKERMARVNAIKSKVNAKVLGSN
ncbi:60S ribosomal protein L5 [Cavenderia fasciculata]|uniref:60S ribosomal protein L5 n=1 Tax=Cavenderia fasciculata TaxID=261658 RepID=F4Q2Y0_CACFS|nr:60S ribosomal protein L5 [Cavenderia fasciculata]EGG17544.1 60S ribosomal protein L5 [Cavenderia fasciculata]|eukprot:XP_004356028.1 60S ribosomal protein L5 [Cavenderia fasciculata]